MKTYYVEDMVCNHCVERIEKALKAENIVFEVDLSNHIVRSDDDKVYDILYDLGFSPKNM